MALETATYIDDLQATWPANTDAISAGDDHLRLIKKVLQNTFPYVTGPVGVSDTILTRGAVPINAVTVFYMAAAPTGWARVSVAHSRCLRVVVTGASGGVSGGTDDPIVNAKVGAHYHFIDFTSGQQNANHTHTLTGETANEVSHTHALTGGTASPEGMHAHYVNLTTGSTGTVKNQGNIPSGGDGGNAALTGSSDGSHVHSVQGYSGYSGAHSHAINGRTTAGSPHNHPLIGKTADQDSDHAHAVSGQSATPTVTESGGTLGAWRPRYADVILCQRTS